MEVQESFKDRKGRVFKVCFHTEKGELKHALDVDESAFTICFRAENVYQTNLNVDQHIKHT